MAQPVQPRVTPSPGPRVRPGEAAILAPVTPTTQEATAVPTAPSAPVTTATPVATGIRFGYLTQEQMQQIISKHEGGPESVYGDFFENRPDPSDPKGKRKIRVLRNKHGERPEEWSKRVLKQEKKLTEFTFKELLEYQKYRNKTKDSSGAVGISGFLPSTIFGKNMDGTTTGRDGKKYPAGLFVDGKFSWDDKFTLDNQKKMMTVLNQQMIQQLKPLEKMGITEITPGVRLAANYIGAGGLAAVVKEAKEGNPNMSVAEAYKKHIGNDPTRGGLKKLEEGIPLATVMADKTLINRDLLSIAVKDFIRMKEEFALREAVRMNMIDERTGKPIELPPELKPAPPQQRPQPRAAGQRVSDASVFNKDQRMAAVSQPFVYVQNNNTTVINRVGTGQNAPRQINNNPGLA